MGKNLRDAAIEWEKLRYKKGAGTYITQVPCLYLGKEKGGIAINRNNLTIALLVGSLPPIPRKI